MVVLVTKIKGKTYKTSGYLAFSLNKNTFILQGNGHISSFQRTQEGIEFEFNIEEFDDGMEKNLAGNNFSEIDPEYTKLIEDEDLQWQYKLEHFRRLEAIMKEEGIIE